jgi:hypothetical protein
MMNLPGFTGELSLGKSTRTYRGQYWHGSLPQNQVGIPANIVPTQLEGMGGLEDLEEAELMEDLAVEDTEAEETAPEEELDIQVEA